VRHASSQTHAAEEKRTDAFRASRESDGAAVKIGIAIKNYNSAELTRRDMLADASDVWETVRRLTGRSKNTR